MNFVKKNNQKGFLLVETLVASIFILGSLVFLFVQFRNVNQSYQISFKYNTVDALYASENLKKFYLNDNFENMAQLYRTNKLKYIDLTTCPSSMIKEVSYCQKLIEILDVKTVLFTDSDTNYIDKVLETSSIEPSLKRFIKYIKNDDEGVLLKYRLIVEMNDGTFASIKIY